MPNLSLEIPRDVYLRAYYNSSFVPEKRATDAAAGDDESLAADYANLAALADTDEKRELLESEFERYRLGRRKRVMEWMHSRSRVVSPMIAGPSNFPVRRMEKYGRWERNKLDALIEHREKALDAIRKKLRPEDRPIMAGDADAVDRLKALIEEAEKYHALMKAVNAVIRKKKLDRDAKIAGMVELGLSAGLAGKLLEPDCMGDLGFAGYELTNHNAKIKRLKGRLAEISKAKATESEEIEGKRATVEIVPAENRVRIYFPGKPDRETIADLKKSGFRWAPSMGAWSGYINDRTVATAKRLAG